MGEGKVLVTGATGYAAGHCIRELLTSGYRVRGTVRSLAHAEISHLRRLDRGGELEFTQTRLDADDGWAQAARGCDYLWHVASPMPFKLPKNEDELIRPAVDGTLRALRAAATAGIRRVVLTSSVDAITHNHATAGRVRTEDDWSEPDECAPYGKSKVYAERAAWDFAADHDLELVTLLPGAIIGPPLRQKKESSADIVRRMLAAQMPVLPPLQLSYTDVRDLATAHRLALETPAAAGNRYICADEHMDLVGIARILAAEYGPHGYRVATRTAPAWTLRAAAVFSAEARLATVVLGVPQVVSAAKAKRELGWRPRTVRESVIDTAEYLIRSGIVSPRRGRRALTA